MSLTEDFKTRVIEGTSLVVKQRKTRQHYILLSTHGKYVQLRKLTYTFFKGNILYIYYMWFKLKQSILLWSKCNQRDHMNRIMCIISIHILCVCQFAVHWWFQKLTLQILRWHQESFEDGVPGTVSFSTVNSTHDEMAARVYSTLWLRRNESSDRLWGLMMAVTRYSE